MKVLLTESTYSLLREGYTTILSPSSDHKNFATILKNQAPLWQDFGKDLAMKTFGLTENELAAALGKSKRGGLNGFLNFYKIDRAGFVPTGYRDLQNNPDTPAIGFVVKDAGKTFGFTITKDAEEKEVVYGNAFFIHTQQGPVPDWRRHLKYFMDTGKKAMTGNVKNLGDDYFAKLSQKVGFKKDLILTVLSEILFHYSSTNRIPDWETMHHSVKDCKFLTCKLFLSFFNKDNFNISVQHLKSMYPNWGGFEKVIIPSSDDQLENIEKKYPSLTRIDKSEIKDFLDKIESSNGLITVGFKDFVNTYSKEYIKSINQTELWDILNNYSATIKQFLESQKI